MHSRLDPVEPLSRLVVRAQRGDVQAYGELVEACQGMAYALACHVLRDSTLALDAVQEAFLRAHGRLADIRDPEAFAGWLRRIVITVATNMRRGRRVTLLRLDDSPELPVLDDIESSWSEAQRHRLARALLTLSSTERQLCDRRYHGGWTTARLASHAGVSEHAVRKRLQRLRDKLRKEMEVAEQNEHRLKPDASELPAKIVELLTHPRLTDLPENPVGKTQDVIRSVFPEFVDVELPEIVELSHAEAVKEAIYLAPGEWHRLDEHRILRYDLTLPLLLTVRHGGTPLRLWASGKAYRHCQPDASHLEVFHQAEVFWMDDREQIDQWKLAGQILESVNLVLPGCAVRIMPTQYAMCSQAWELEADYDGRSLEVLAWGVYTPAIVRHLGGDPDRHTAIGIGYGLERLAGLRYKIDDIRRIEMANVS